MKFTIKQLRAKQADYLAQATAAQADLKRLRAAYLAVRAAQAKRKADRQQRAVGGE